MSRTFETAARLRAHADTVEALDLPLDEVPSGHDWTRARILRHVVMTVEPYIAALERVLPTLPVGSGEHQSGFGRRFEAIAGPKGNAPVPPKLKPRATPSDPTVVSDFVRVHRRLAELGDQAATKDARRACIPIPLFPLIKLTPLEVLLVQASHADRHVGQVLR